MSTPFGTVAPEVPADDTLLTAIHVRRRFGGISDMTLWRWLRDDRLNFPQPVVINRRRFWRLGDLIAFEERQRAACREDAA